MIEPPHYQLYIRVTVVTLIALSYGLIVGGTTLIIGESYLISNPVLLAITIVILALGFNPLRKMLQETIFSKFRWIKPINEQLIYECTRDLSAAKTSETITDILRQFVIEKMNPSQLHIYLRDPVTSSYKCMRNEVQGMEQITSEIIFNSNSALVKTLSKKKTPLFIDTQLNTAESINSDRSKIALMGSSTFIPLHGRTQLVGWIALGNQHDGFPYKRKELDILLEISDQAALIVERVQLSSDLERRINEMNVLTRVSQGVNITLALEDMLELIYTQINQIIKIDVFYVALISPEDNKLKYVFYVDEEERNKERENSFLLDRYGLDREVISGQRPILTEDYEKECRIRGSYPSIQNIYAWMGVPLNTGAETIGLISLGIRQPDLQISKNHINLLQSIADQTAGAMVKVRLLQEAERRTNQLRYLNKISRNLSETLEPGLLLNLVLDGAMKLLNCESGGIYLIDQHSNKLFRRETIGSFYLHIDENLRNEIEELRVKVVAESNANTFHSEISSSDTHENSSDRSMSAIINGLVVPLILKDKPVGIIEVFNRKDGIAFTKDDLELLNTFAGQSAIAYDIAEKYTFTDQSLAARVEELSVMQQIDQELNASLDVSRAMKITMKWAIQQSHAESGFVGVVEGNSIHVMAAYGYNKKSSPEEVIINADTPLLKKVLESREPINTILNDIHDVPSQISILEEGTQAEYIIPIVREEQVIGVISLGSNKLHTLNDEEMAFLIRLSDHAAIAIANAQLYREVQAANLAKSDFVSFVSHELKTPMTSIKGFADLLAAGAVGPISEAQNNFLNTIRSNVDRMAALVSDLTDVSRIEAGRMKLEFESVSVDDVVDEVVRSSNNQLMSNEQTLIIEIDKKLPAMWGDRTRIIQILTNIISNANKYSPNNSRIKIYGEQCDNLWDPSGPKSVIHIYVKDNGYGISPQDQSKVFEKFFRADDPNIREVSGTGLGLNITKTLVEMQGGKIWFESMLNKGTTFHITIPTSDTR